MSIFSNIEVLGNLEYKLSNTVMYSYIFNIEIICISFIICLVMIFSVVLLSRRLQIFLKIELEKVLLFIIISQMFLFIMVMNLKGGFYNIIKLENTDQLLRDGQELPDLPSYRYNISALFGVLILNFLYIIK